MWPLKKKKAVYDFSRQVSLPPRWHQFQQLSCQRCLLLTVSYFPAILEACFHLNGFQKAVRRFKPLQRNQLRLLGNQHHWEPPPPHFYSPKGHWWYNLTNMKWEWCLANLKVGWCHVGLVRRKSTDLSETENVNKRHETEKTPVVWELRTYNQAAFSFDLHS